MLERNRKIMFFDIIYGILILALLLELIFSGSFNVKSDSLLLTFSIAAALLIVLLILKEQKIHGNEIKHPRFFGRKFR